MSTYYCEGPYIGRWPCSPSKQVEGKYHCAQSTESWLHPAYLKSWHSENRPPFIGMGCAIFSEDPTISKQETLSPMGASHHLIFEMSIKIFCDFMSYCSIPQSQPSPKPHPPVLDPPSNLAGVGLFECLLR